MSNNDFKKHDGLQNLYCGEQTVIAILVILTITLL